MSLLSAFLIGAALAADAFAVSVVWGSHDRTKRLRGGILTAGMFALFQMLMPVLGWSIGKAGSRWIESFDHIAAFGILVFLGIKMIADSRDTSVKNNNGFNIRMLLAVSVATSIDALTAGIILPAAAGVRTAYELITAVTVIGAVTFAICAAGYFSGRRISKLNPAAAQICGGIVLILIGIKTMISG